MIRRLMNSKKKLGREKLTKNSNSKILIASTTGLFKSPKSKLKWTRAPKNVRKSDKAKIKVKIAWLAIALSTATEPTAKKA